MTQRRSSTSVAFGVAIGMLGKSGFAMTVKLKLNALKAESWVRVRFYDTGEMGTGAISVRRELDLYTHSSGRW